MTNENTTSVPKDAWTPEGKRQQFLGALRVTGSPKAACGAVGVARRTVYDWRERYPGFQQEWHDIVEGRVDELEARLLDRALNGTKKEVFQHGKLVGHLHEFNERREMFALERLRPGKWSAEAAALGGSKSVQEQARELRAAVEAMNATMGVPDAPLPGDVDSKALDEGQC